MKKILLTLTIVLGLALGSSAQNNKSAFGLGVNIGLPVGDASDASSITIGGDLRYEVPVANNTFISFSGGYTYFPYKSSVTSALRSFGIDKSGEGFVPLKVGGKYLVDTRFYLEGQVGVAISTESGGGNGFAYVPGIGFKISDKADVGVRYEGWTKGGSTVSQLALRLGFTF